MVQNKRPNQESEHSLHINRRHKDSLFRIAFREKEKLLELYNAIHNSEYDDPAELTIYTIEDVVFMGIKNDISFLVGETLNLYEHQSTENPNMPIRGLMYFAKNYESYIARNDLDIYGSRRQPLPFPQYYVLYNGAKDTEDKKVLELKDAFPELGGIEPCLNCRATLLNINCGHNREIMERSQTLKDYSVYIQRIRDNKVSGISISEAVEKATKTCIRDGILKDILIKNSAEVKHMVLGTWGTENHLRKQREEREQIEKENARMEKEHARMEKEHARMEKENARMEKEHARMEKENARIEKENKQLKWKNTVLEEKEIELKRETNELKREATSFKQRSNELENRSAAIDLLTQILLDAGKIGELRRTLKDEVYRRELLEEYALLGGTRN
ncbi:MAG: hypothetical protein HFH12_01580 [Dorea sp.]|nr:hypothetical protein [Dorea sp.]